MKNILILAFTVSVSAVSLSGCATISEEKCAAGTWEDIGYNHGRSGKSRGKFADLAEGCMKYGIAADRTDYLSGYVAGLPLYCTYDKGYNRGQAGNSPKDVCETMPDNGYYAGHADGYETYQIRTEYEGLLSRYDETLAALVETERRLREDDLSGLTDGERKDLRKKVRQLERRAADLRIDMRAMEHLHGIAPHSFN